MRSCVGDEVGPHVSVSDLCGESAALSRGSRQVAPLTRVRILLR